MTLPNEEKQALQNARMFLLSLLEPKKTPRVPLAIRREAQHCLRHYPWSRQVEELYKGKEKR